LTHGAEPFWRSRQFCSYSRTSQHFMELEGSLPCSQEPPSSLSKINFNIVHPPATCPVHLILFALGEGYKLRSSSLCSFLQPPVTSSLFDSNINLNTLFSNTLSLCSSLKLRDQVIILYTYSNVYAFR
ncbi:hypothetical protein B7P43_G10657, partial [Cryptotermes secundus]